MTDRVAQLLELLLREVAALRVAVEARYQSRRLAPVDRELLEHLLPAIHRAVGARAFNVRELIEHAALPHADTAGLRVALAKVAGGARAIGRLLRRADGLAVGGLVARCVGEDRDGLLWVISPLKPALTTCALDARDALGDDRHVT